MGGDFAPEQTTLGAIHAWKELPASVKLVLIGNKEAIVSILNRENVPVDAFEIVQQYGSYLNLDLMAVVCSLSELPIAFDAVFIAMHGTPGEDGKLQGYFDTLKIPYTSCDAATSAITFNKRY